MERMFTPWRMAYIAAPHGRGCILCEKPAQDDDRGNLIVYRGRHCYVLLNLYPYNNGHLMIAPYAHIGNLEDLPPETAADLMHLTQKSLRALKCCMSPHGFNIGMNLGRVAGAGIADHVHLHIVPRWQGDTNFMPVIAGTKLIPELLEETYDKLHRAFQEI